MIQRGEFLLQAVLWAACHLVLGLAWASGADWPNWRGPDRNGISAETTWTSSWPGEGPPILWRASVGTGFSSMSVQGNRLYTMGNRHDKDIVFCLEAATGRVLWQHAYAAPLEAKSYEGGPSATPTLHEGRVYTLSKRGRLFCLDAASGGVVWEKDLPGELRVPVNEWGFASSPVVEGDLVLLNVGGAGTAVEKATGNVAWTSAAQTTGYASAVPFSLGAARMVALFAAKALVLVEARTGRELWRHPWETGWDNNNADPIIAGNRIFISSYSRGCALLEVSADQARVLYAVENMNNHMSASVKIGSHLYGINGREGRGRPNDLRCLEFLTGKVLWTHVGLGVGGLTAAGDRLIVLSETGELAVVAAKPEVCQTLARTQVLGGRCWTPPVLSGGRIFCRNAKGDVVCVDVRGPNN
jgi:outer membrane protein assembly factor BamB